MVSNSERNRPRTIATPRSGAWRCSLILLTLFLFFFLTLPSSLSLPSWYFARGTHPRSVLSTILSFLPRARNPKGENSADSFFQHFVSFTFNLNNMDKNRIKRFICFQKRDLADLLRVIRNNGWFIIERVNNCSFLYFIRSNKSYRNTDPISIM